MQQNASLYDNTNNKRGDRGKKKKKNLDVQPPDTRGPPAVRGRVRSARGQFSHSPENLGRRAAKRSSARSDPPL
ncbi:hypothetical protein GN956_G19792 [Arapaima gigas]